MTDQEALMQALVEVEESKLTFTDDGPEGESCLGCGDAAAIIAALPEGWRLYDVLGAHGENGKWYRRGAAAERERLHKKAGTSRTAANISVFLDWLFEAQPDD